MGWGGGRGGNPVAVAVENGFHRDIKDPNFPCKNDPVAIMEISKFMAEISVQC